MNAVFRALDEAAEQHRRRVGTSVMNEVLEDGVRRRPPFCDDSPLDPARPTPPPRATSRGIGRIGPFARHRGGRLSALTHSGATFLIWQVRWQKPPSTSRGQQGAIYYCAQVSTRPPSIAIFCNDPALFSASYGRLALCSSLAAPLTEGVARARASHAGTSATSTATSESRWASRARRCG